VRLVTDGGHPSSDARGRRARRYRGRTGSIQQGLEADLIVVDRNPLENILSLQDVLMVVNNGKVVLDRLSFALE